MSSTMVYFAANRRSGGRQTRQQGREVEVVRKGQGSETIKVENKAQTMRSRDIQVPTLEQCHIIEERCIEICRKLRQFGFGTHVIERLASQAREWRFVADRNTSDFRQWHTQANTLLRAAESQIRDETAKRQAEAERKLEARRNELRPKMDRITALLAALAQHPDATNVGSYEIDLAYNLHDVSLISEKEYAALNTAREKTGERERIEEERFTFEMKHPEFPDLRHTVVSGQIIEVDKDLIWTAHNSHRLGMLSSEDLRHFERLYKRTKRFEQIELEASRYEDRFDQERFGHTATNDRSDRLVQECRARRSHRDRLDQRKSWRRHNRKVNYNN